MTQVQSIEQAYTEAQIVQVVLWLTRKPWADDALRDTLLSYGGSHDYGSTLAQTMDELLTALDLWPVVEDADEQVKRSKEVWEAWVDDLWEERHGA